jgi:tetratricopeptide (TPR) repeat protein
MRYSVLLSSFCLLLLGLAACGTREGGRGRIPEVPQVSDFYGATNLQALLEAVEDDEEDAESYYQIARIFLYKKQHSKALSYIQKAWQQDSSRAEYAYLAAKIHLSEGQYKQALPYAQKAYLELASLPNALLLAELYLQSGQYTLSEKYLRLAERVSEREALIAYTRGRLLATQGDSLRAYQSFQQALGLRPDFPDTYKHFAGLLNQMQRFQEALQIAQKGLVYRSGEDSLYLQKGIAWRSLKRSDSARVAFEQAYQRNVRFYEASYELGKAAFLSGNYKGAIKYLESSLRYQKKQPKIHYYLGISLQQQGRLPEALQALREALSAAPEDGEAYYAYYALKERIEMEQYRRRQDSLYKIQQEYWRQQNIVPEEQAF